MIKTSHKIYSVIPTAYGTKLVLYASSIKNRGGFLMRTVQDAVESERVRQDVVKNMDFAELLAAAKAYVGKVPPAYRHYIVKNLSTEKLALNHLRSLAIHGY